MQPSIQFTDGSAAQLESANSVGEGFAEKYELPRTAGGRQIATLEAAYGWRLMSSKTTSTVGIDRRCVALVRF